MGALAQKEKEEIMPYKKILKKTAKKAVKRIVKKRRASLTLGGVVSGKYRPTAYEKKLLKIRSETFQSSQRKTRNIALGVGFAGGAIGAYHLTKKRKRKRR